jgi:hypothetical protein
MLNSALPNCLEYANAFESYQRPKPCFELA